VCVANDPPALPQTHDAKVACRGERHLDARDRRTEPTTDMRVEQRTIIGGVGRSACVHERVIGCERFDETAISVQRVGSPGKRSAVAVRCFRPVEASRVASIRASALDTCAVRADQRHVGDAGSDTTLEQRVARRALATERRQLRRSRLRFAHE
jgi:hypothetical protein